MSRQDRAARLDRLVTILGRASAMTEAAIAFPIVLIAAIGLMQFAIYRHATNVVVGAVQDGAEVAARADYTVQDGVDRTHELLQAGLGPTAAVMTIEGIDGTDEVGIQATGQLQLIIPWAGNATLPLAYRAVESKEHFRRARGADRYVPQPLGGGPDAMNSLSWAGLRCRLERGAVLAWAAVMMPVFLMAVGLVVDGGAAFDARRDLQNTADAAARAGAMQIDQQVYRASNGTTLVLDQASARATAAQYVASQGADFNAVISSDDQHVLVSVNRDVPTNFLRLAGIGTVHISATVPAEVRYGIDKGNK